jgi:hypothetical protein
MAAFRRAQAELIRRSKLRDPQGLKPASLWVLSGTTEVVPFPETPLPGAIYEMPLENFA